MTHVEELRTPGPGRMLWLDVSAGVAGDMILAALIDAGASLDFVRTQVEAVVPGAVALSVTAVSRAGLRATKANVVVSASDVPHRTWLDVERLLQSAALDPPVREQALAVFGRLADAEARVHGIAAGAVHFHEVGALDSIADVVGSCAALVDLNVTTLLAGPIALGSGTTRSEHGLLPVPVPAVLELAREWSVFSGGSGELATPTGVAIVTTLAAECAALPAMRIEAVGVGAGTRDPADRANVVRAVLGKSVASAPVAGSPEVVVEANVDDLDPRLWPGVLAVLLEAGAQDAWLTPILMKKGRPAHTVHALVRPADVSGIRTVLLEQTSTFGLRSYAVDKYAMPRSWLPVSVGGDTVRVKIAHENGVVRQATPEFGDAEQAAERLELPVREVLRLAEVAAARAGLTVGEPWPIVPTE